MTVTSETSQVEYISDGVSLDFPIDFYFLEETDIQVVVSDSDGVIYPVVLDVDYTITGAGNPSGGSLHFTIAQPLDFKIAIIRNAPATQLTDYQPNDDFPAKSHERALDKLTMLVQQLLLGISNSLRKNLSGLAWDFLGLRGTNVGAPVDPTDVATKGYADTLNGKSVRTPEAIPALPVAASRAGMLLSFDGLGNPITVTPASSSAADLELRLRDPVNPANGAEIVAVSLSGAVLTSSTVRKELSPTVSGKRYDIVPDTGNDLTSKWADAFADLAVTGGRIVLAPGIYDCTINFTHPGITIDGLRMPVFDGTGLVNGTIIRGAINLGGQRGASITNLGVDQRFTGNGVLDGITQGGAISTQLMGHVIENVAVLGRGFAENSNHGVLLNKQPGYRVNNLRTYRYFHGLALKQGYGTVKDLYSFDNEGSTLIVKSDALDSMADVIMVDVNGVFGECSGAVPLAVASITIESVDAAYKTSAIGISNVNLKNHLATTVYPITTRQTAGEISDIDFVNVHVNDCAADRGYGFLSGSKITLVNCHGRNVAGFTFRNSSATEVSLTSCWSTNPGAGGGTGHFFGAFVKGEVNAAPPLVLKVTGATEATSGGVEASANGSDGEVRIYRYSGSSGLFYGSKMISNGQGLKWMLAPTASAKGSETYTVTGIEMDPAGNLKNNHAYIEGGAVYSPQASGTTLTIGNNISLEMILPSTDPIATLTINMPATPVDQQKLKITSSKAITTITHSGNGKTLNSPLTTLAAGQSGEWIYRLSDTTWYRIG